MIDQGTNICTLTGKLETVKKDIGHGLRGLFEKMNNKYKCWNYYSMHLSDSDFLFVDPIIVRGCMLTRDDTIIDFTIPIIDSQMKIIDYEFVLC